MQRVICLFTAFIMMSISVFAENTHDANFKISVNENSEVQIIETDLSGETDNSDLDVKVISVTKTGKSIVFSGKLGDYDNGNWKYLDFSQIQLMALYDWNDPENYFVIVPEENMSMVSSVNNLADVRAGGNTDSDFDCNMIFHNKSAYCENIFEPSSAWGVDIEIKNDSQTDETVQPYIVVYQNEKMTRAFMGDSYNLGSGQEVVLSENFMLPGKNIEEYSVCVFNWNNDMKPLTGKVLFSAKKEDCFKNNIDGAMLISDISKEVDGNINTGSDKDYLKFVPENTNRYSLKCFSVSDIDIALYNSDGDLLEDNAETLEMDLVSGNTYYIEISGDTGKYVFTIQEDPSSEEENFDVYEFDEDINVYKNLIKTYCDELYYDDEDDLLKQIYMEYELILDSDIKLHNLPYFLSEHPKSISNFDELLNRYYGTRYDEFQSVEQKYISLINEYVETDDADIMELFENTEDEPVVQKFSIPEISLIEGETHTQQYETRNIRTGAEPSLNIYCKTETSITYDVIFPVSGQVGNTICIVDFNTDDGIIALENVYGADICRTDGRYTISGPKPGGIYLLAMTWSNNGGQSYGGESTKIYYVQMPGSTQEILSAYQGKYVTALMEESDKAIASASDFNKWLGRMDKVYYAYKELTGYTPFNSTKIKIKSTRENLNHIYGDGGENYYNVVCGRFDGTNTFNFGRVHYQGLMKRLQYDDWGSVPIHELSHAFDSDRWVFDSETLAQLKIYYVMEQLDANVYELTEAQYELWYEGDEYYDYLKYERFMDSYVNSFENGYYASEGFAALLLDIQNKIGWEPFKKTFRYFNSLSSSQVLYDEGDILNLFLTKLRDYSGIDVLDEINDRDKEIIENWFGVTLEYSDPIYPDFSDTGGWDSDMNIPSTGEVSLIYEFTPEDSGTYYIYTSPYGESGASNDTYLEVYDNEEMSGTPLASNDDFDEGRFSKVTIQATEGVTYYIKVTHNDEGQLHAKLNITRVVSDDIITPGEYRDITVNSGESAVYRFTPQNSMTYVFEAGKHTGEINEYDTYLKLYEDENMTKRIGHDRKRIVARLEEGHTYYLQFSGFFLRYARACVSVKQGQTVEFTKDTGSNFIFVNSPEYITRFDITDGTMNDEHVPTKIFEQSGIIGKNTYYQTHLCWYGTGGLGEYYFPENAFYLDVDFYNESDEAVTVEISNIAYGLSYTVMGDYYGNSDSYSFTILPGKHLLLSDMLGSLPAEEYKEPIYAEGFEHRPTIMFDFNVSGGSVMVSSLAAYNRYNLYLRDNSTYKLQGGIELSKGYPDINYASNRPDEQDYPGKYKGTAWNQSAWIDSEIDFLIDEYTLIGEPQPIYLQDDFYDEIANPKWSWKTALNPIHDETSGVLSAMPGALHSFRYPSQFVGKEWYFDFLHHDLTLTDSEGTGASVNTPVSDEAVNELKSVVAQGEKLYEGAIDANAVSLGEWGATYHYTINVTNVTDEERTAVFGCRNFESMTLGYKLSGESVYTTEYEWEREDTDDNWWEPVSYSVPANSTITFEVVTTLGVSFGGTRYHFVVN